MKKGRMATAAAAAAAMVTMLGHPTPSSARLDFPRATLENGLEVIVIEDHTVPLVTIEVAVHNGAYAEPPAYNGLSHFYEHMFFKANAVIPSQERYLERLRELGALWNGTTSTERVNYYFTLHKDNLEPGMVFMRDALLTPLFLEEEIVKERKVVTGEMDRAESSPSRMLYRAVSKKLWWKYFSYKDVLGDREIIESVTSKKMLDISKKFYVPNNSALIVAGDTTLEEVLPMAKKMFGDWKRGPGLGKLVTHPAPKGYEVVVLERDVGKVTFQLGWHGPDTDRDPDSTYAADVFSFILGLRTSKFYTRLVDEGPCLSAGISYYTQRNVGPINLSCTVSIERAAEALPAMLAEVARFDEPDYFSDEEIENAKRRLETDYEFEREKTSTYVHTVSFWWSSAGLDYYLTYLDRLRAVSRDDMTKYVRTYIKGKAFVAGALMSAEAKEKTGLDGAKLAAMVKEKTGAKKVKVDEDPLDEAAAAAKKAKEEAKKAKVEAKKAKADAKKAAAAEKKGKKAKVDGKADKGKKDKKGGAE